MFEIGKYIVYGYNGICKVEDVTHITDISGIDRKKLYYILKPLVPKGSTIYAPTEGGKTTARTTITKEEAKELIEEIPSLSQLWIDNERLREFKYKEAMETCDYRMWVRMIKTLYTRKKQRILDGKKITSTDEKYMRKAEENLYSELSIALNIDRDEVEGYICHQIEETEN